MIAVISCSHYADDERVYHKQIQSLLKDGCHISYFTRDNSSVVHHENLSHTKYDKQHHLKKYIKDVCDKLNSLDDLTHVQIHESDLLPILKWVKTHFPNVVTVYDVHEHMDSLYRTFSTRSKPIKELAISLRNRRELSHLPFVDHIILANPSFSDSIYDRVTASKTVIENFPELKYYSDQERNMAKNHQLIYHGHLGPERGIEDLVKAMKRVHQDYPETSLTLIGTFRTKAFEQKIHNLISTLESKSYIQIKSQIPHDKIWNELSAHQIGIIPFRENPLTMNNVPTKLFEMMSAGLIIVASQVPPIEYYVSDSIYWSKPGDVESLSKALKTAICSGTSSEMIQSNYQLIKSKYNWSNIEDKFLSIFKV